MKLEITKKALTGGKLLTEAVFTFEYEIIVCAFVFIISLKMSLEHIRFEKNLKN